MSSFLEDDEFWDTYPDSPIHLNTLHGGLDIRGLHYRGSVRADVWSEFTAEGVKSANHVVEAGITSVFKGRNGRTNHYTVHGAVGGDWSPVLDEEASVDD